MSVYNMCAGGSDFSSDRQRAGRDKNNGAGEHCSDGTSLHLFYY